MADITRNSDECSPDGHTEPAANVRIVGPATAGRVVTLGSPGTTTGNWEVLRTDGDVVHLVRADRAATLKKEHTDRGMNADGSLRSRQ